jgi:hypothetical protein
VSGPLLLPALVRISHRLWEARMPHVALVGCTSGSGSRLVAAARQLGYRITAVLPPDTPGAPAADHVLYGADVGQALTALRKHHARHPLDAVLGCGGASEEVAARAARALGLPGADPVAVGNLTPHPARTLRPLPAQADGADHWSGPRYVLPVLVEAGAAEVVALGEVLRPGTAGAGVPMFPAPALLPWQRHRLTAAAVAAIRSAGVGHGAYQVHLVLTGQGPRLLSVTAGIGEPPVPELVAETTGTDLATAAIQLATGPTALSAAA